MKKLLIKQMMLAASVIFLGACGSDNETTAPDPTADFTAAADGSNALTINFTNTSKDASTYEWDFGDGSHSTDKDPSHTYAKGGAYKVKLVATATSGKTAEKEDLTTSKANLIGGGDMELSTKASWTIDTLNAPAPTSWEFSDGSLSFWNDEGTETNILVWQPIYVEKGKEYLFSAHVKGGGASNMWFEVYFGATKPAKGADYTDNKYIALNTWSGCAIDPVDGDLATIGCDGSGKDAAGIITFENTGVVYFAIKTGVWDGAFTNAVSIDDVSVTLHEGD
jgi:PKD repeat protein